MIATAWPPGVRADLESAYRRGSGDVGPIAWVAVALGERASSLLDRRGGVDLVLGGSPDEALRMADAGRLAPLDAGRTGSWRLVLRPSPKSVEGASPDPAGSPRALVDPRDDALALARARARLDEQGWPAGYEGLVREAAGARLIFGRAIDEASSPADESESRDRREILAMPTGGRSPARARRFASTLEGLGLVEPASTSDPGLEATADGLLADLLGAALVDAHEELRDADAALRRFGHPARAEASLGERPPWPPASVAKLQASPAGAALLETLAEQVAPDPEARAWLLKSWSGPRRAVDGGLLIELAGAVEGRLAREPRFRGWLRGEWTAWTRQLYRRVARVAGGYVPS